MPASGRRDRSLQRPIAQFVHAGLLTIIELSSGLLIDQGIFAWNRLQIGALAL